METLQNQIRNIINDQLEDVNSSIASSLFIYDFFKSGFSNNKLDCILSFNKIDKDIYLSVNLFNITDKKTFNQKIDIFLEENYNNQLMLNTEETYIDGEYLTEEEYEIAIERLDKSKKYKSSLFNNTSFLFTEEQKTKIKKIIEVILKEESGDDIFYQIKKNKLEHNYELLRMITKIPELDNLSYNYNSIENLIKIKNKIKDINVKNSDNLIQELRDLNIQQYQLLCNKLPKISCFIQNNTKKIIANKKNNTFTYHRSDLISFTDILNNNSFKINDYNNLEQYNLGLLNLDINTKDKDDIIFYALNKNKEIAGALIIGKTEDNNIYNIKSLSTNIKFRGKNISSTLYKNLIEYAVNMDLIIMRGYKTEDNKKYISEKLNIITEKSNAFIVERKHKNLFNYIKKYFNGDNKYNKELFNNFIILAKTKNSEFNNFSTFINDKDIINFIKNIKKPKSKIKIN